MSERSPILGTTSHTAPDYGTASSDLPQSSHVSVNVLGTSTIAPTSKLSQNVTPKPTKLGTFAGVFVPTSLNVLSILMFLRFGFVLGQAGCLGSIGILIVCYSVDLLTTLSLSAIATNGTVRGGGAYFLISRSLGPEFGGSIGLVFYLGSVFNTGMNAVGMIDCLVSTFGTRSGSLGRWLPEGFWPQYIGGTIVLLVCTAICMAGSGIFARASNGLLVVLLIATFSIPISAMIAAPFTDPSLHTEFTGPSWATLNQNFFPHFTKGAAGSGIKGKENWQNLFGILFPATAGIFAGASMSGDLQHPSRAIPKGTLSGLGLTFFTYSTVIVSLAATVTRETLYRNLNVIADINLWPGLILCGELATSFFSALMGLIGASKVLQAVARDDIVPGLKAFGRGFGKGDEPINAIVLSYIISQATMLADINQIATLAAMAFLMTFLVTNLACFLLKLSSAPNFRPSFKWFNLQTAGVGTLASALTMAFVDAMYAGACTGLIGIIFLIIHYTAPPKEWGDVSQSLIYHQVRKYLLRLKTEHVKFWRPQILLLVNDPWRQYELIQFCNSLKKGGLYILGHIIVTPDFGDAVPEAKRQQAKWPQYIDFSKIKAFINITVAPSMEWGVRNVVLGAGLGGMRPNIVVMGFYNLRENLSKKSNSESKGKDVSQNQLGSSKNAGPSSDFSRFDGVTPKHIALEQIARLRGIAVPTDLSQIEKSVCPQTYVQILEDLLLDLQINVAIGKGFHGIEMPSDVAHGLFSKHGERYIDLWPIQMSAQIVAEDNGPAGLGHRSVLTTNFDTYTMILQLGVILSTVPSWKKRHKLRVAVFVEYESDVAEERRRVENLLARLRIQAEVLVFWLACGDVATYEIIVNGKGVEDGISQSVVDAVESALRGEDWWQDAKRRRSGEYDNGDEGADAGSENINYDTSALYSNTDSPLFSPAVSSAFNIGLSNPQTIQLQDMGLPDWGRDRRRATIQTSTLDRLGVSLGMIAQQLDPRLGHHSSSSSSSDDEHCYTDRDASVLTGGAVSNRNGSGGGGSGFFSRGRRNSSASFRTPGFLPRALGRMERLKNVVRRQSSWGQQEREREVRFADAVHPRLREQGQVRMREHQRRHSEYQPRPFERVQSDVVVHPIPKPVIPDCKKPAEARNQPSVEETSSSMHKSDMSVGSACSSRARGRNRVAKPAIPSFSSRPVPAALVKEEEELVGPSIMFDEQDQEPSKKEGSHEGTKKRKNKGKPELHGTEDRAQQPEGPVRLAVGDGAVAGERALSPLTVPLATPRAAASSASSYVSTPARSPAAPSLPGPPPCGTTGQPGSSVTGSITGDPHILSALSPSAPSPDSAKSERGQPSVSEQPNENRPVTESEAVPVPGLAADTGAESPSSGTDTTAGSVLTNVTGATSMSRTASLPLSFNDLPSRAQHIILNELIRKHSGDGKPFTFPRIGVADSSPSPSVSPSHSVEAPLSSPPSSAGLSLEGRLPPAQEPNTSRTAVVFTTLPCPLNRTSESEEQSLRYLVDLEVMCLGLPPALLVHSNSMTVTVNL